MTQLTVGDAARLARVSEDEIRAALRDGDLRSLERAAVAAWARARVAATVTRSVQP
jgi:hypothetical protein